jgi:5'-phosphate synthase pdxT subunit
MVMQVGVLALQGDWEAHLSALRDVAVPAEPVRTAAALERVDALVLPGGESTAMLRLMADERLAELIVERIRAGMPVLATCAGVILLARAVEPPQTSLALLDVAVVRNAYGRQVHSSGHDRCRARLGGPRDGGRSSAPRIVSTGATCGCWAATVAIPCSSARADRGSHLPSRARGGSPRPRPVPPAPGGPRCLTDRSATTSSTGSTASFSTMAPMRSTCR